MLFAFVRARYWQAFIFSFDIKKLPGYARVANPGRKIFLPLIRIRIFVELEGFEPSSKQGDHPLSTCLFRPSVFVRKQDPDHPFTPYPLKFHPRREAVADYFRFNCTAESKSFGTTAFERCLVPASYAGIKPIYYTSIRQRERNCFLRQI